MAENASAESNTSNATPPSQAESSKSWIENYRARFQTIGSASLGWHDMIGAAIKQNKALRRGHPMCSAHNALDKVVHVSDWTVHQKVPVLEFLEALEKVMPDTMFMFARRDIGVLTASDRANNSSAYCHYAYCDDERLLVVRGGLNRNLEVDVTTFDGSFVKDVSTVCVEWDMKFQETLKAGIFMLTRGAGGYTVVYEDGIGAELERSNYSESELEFVDKIISKLPGGTVGKMAVMYGRPGTGKTHIVYGLLSALKDVCVPVYVPSNYAPALAEPDLFPLLKNLHVKMQKPVLIVVEDADEILVKRDSVNRSQVSNILNLVDGPQGKAADIRLVCTTNERPTDLDQAIKRKGRLLGYLEIASKKPDHARAIWARLHADDGKPYPFSSTYTPHLGEIYTGERDDDPVRSNVGFNR